MTSYLKVSNVTLIVSLLMLSISVIFIWNQYVQLKKNFINNENTHIIEISGKYTKRDGLERVGVSYKEQIKKLLDKKDYENQYNLFVVYQIRFGIDVEGLEDQINIMGIDEDGEKFLKDGQKLLDDTIYSGESIPEQVKVFLPEVTLGENSINLSGETEYVLNSQLIEKKTIFSVYEGINFKPYYVNYATFGKMFEICLGEKISEASLNKFEKIQPIYKVYVYVDDITKVEKIAKVLNAQGYITNFVFASFDDIGASLDMSIKIMLVFSIVLFVFTLISLLLSWKSFIQLQAKDMGILKQMGYPAKNIRKIYQKSIRKSMMQLACIISVCVFIMTVVIFGMKEMIFTISYILALNIVLFMIDIIIENSFLRKQTDKGILELIKVNKSFE